MENNSSPQPLPPQESVTAAEAVTGTRKRRQRRTGTVLASLMDRRRAQPVSMERQSRRSSLMSLASRAVRHATEQEPRSFTSRMERNRLLQKWQRYSAALANYASSWRL